MKRRIIIQKSLFDLPPLESVSIERFKQYEPEAGYYLAFSGGKDSIVLKHLADKSGVKYDAHYNLTTVDPPELVKFIRKFHQDVSIDRPEMNMWQLIFKKGFPPTRRIRYCCEVLKEGGGTGRVVATGIRWEESGQRNNRKIYEKCTRDKTQKFLNPIIDWSSEDIWNYILINDLPYCSLYDEGYHRLGCIMCPFQGGKGQLRDAYRWPTYYKAYLHAFQKCVDKREVDGLLCLQNSGEEMMAWWLQIPIEKLPKL